MKETKKRAIELKRQAWATSTEAKALELPIGSSVSVKSFDLEAYQRLRVRLHRNKLNTGQVFGTSVDGNNIIITRYEDEPVN